MGQKPTELEIRQELGVLLDKLEALPDDALTERSVLAARQEELRAELRTLPIHGADEIMERWSQQAGTKPDDQYEIDPSVLIVSPGANPADSELSGSCPHTRSRRLRLRPV